MKITEVSSNAIRLMMAAYFERSREGDAERDQKLERLDQSYQDVRATFAAHGGSVGITYSIDPDANLVGGLTGIISSAAKASGPLLDDTLDRIATSNQVTVATIEVPAASEEPKE